MKAGESKEKEGKERGEKSGVGESCGGEAGGGGRELSRELKEPTLDGMISENCHWCRKMGRDGDGVEGGGREAGRRLRR